MSNHKLGSRLLLGSRLPEMAVLYNKLPSNNWNLEREQTTQLLTCTCTINVKKWIVLQPFYTWQEVIVNNMPFRRTFHEKSPTYLQTQWHTTYVPTPPQCMTPRLHLRTYSTIYGQWQLLFLIGCWTYPLQVSKKYPDPENKYPHLTHTT